METTTDETTIAALADLAGLTIAPERRAAVARSLDQLAAFARELDALALGPESPDARFDPSWPGEEGDR